MTKTAISINKNEYVWSYITKQTINYNYYNVAISPTTPVYAQKIKEIFLIHDWIHNSKMSVTAAPQKISDTKCLSEVS